MRLRSAEGPISNPTVPGELFVPPPPPTRATKATVGPVYTRTLARSGSLEYKADVDLEQLYRLRVRRGPEHHGDFLGRHERLRLEFTVSQIAGAITYQILLWLNLYDLPAADDVSPLCLPCLTRYVNNVRARAQAQQRVPASQAVDLRSRCRGPLRGVWGSYRFKPRYVYTCCRLTCLADRLLTPFGLCLVLASAWVMREGGLVLSRSLSFVGFPLRPLFQRRRELPSNEGR